MKIVQTTSRDSANLRPVVLAAAVASFFMVVFGVGYRVLAARLNTTIQVRPVSQEALNALPLQVGPWTGQDTSLPPEIVEATDTDAHLSRRYVQEDHQRAISLWIASGVQARDLMPHRPEVCYLGNGYTLVRQQEEELTLNSGGVLPCNIMEFTRGMLNRERVLVLYYYIVDGVYCQSVAQWRYQVLHRIGYVTQVQVVTPVPDALGFDAARKTVSDFAVISATPILDLFESRRTDPNPE